MTPLVKNTERSGWRDDVRLKERHEMYGNNCPACDIDHVLIEYDQKIPRALIEYKHEFAPKTPLTKASLVALRNLANDANLPAYIVRYADNFDWFKVLPINRAGRSKMARALDLPIFDLDEELKEPRNLTECEYVQLLYGLRDRPVPSGLIENLGVSI